MRVAIVRLTSLGDLVHALPLAHALRSHGPVSSTVWVVEEREQALLAGNPLVDEVVVAATRRWRRELRTPTGVARVRREFRALRDRLRALRIDVAIDVQGLLKSAIFTVLTRAPMRIGFGWGHAREPLSALFMTHRVSPPPSAVHVVEKNLALLAPLDVPVREVAFPLPPVLPAEARAQALLESGRLAPRRRVVALLPGTRGSRKQWPPAFYAELARRLGKEVGVTVLPVAGPGEEGLTRLITDGLDGDCVTVPTSSLSIPELVAIFRRVQLVVGNDTGPLHLAAAVGVPTLGLFGPTCPERNGPYGPRGRVLRSPTGRMKDLAVETVFRAAMEGLG